MMPSGPSEMISVADMSLTPFFFSWVFVPGTVVAVPSKTVQLPDQHNVKQLLVAVLNHLLELRAVVRLGGDSTVNIVLDDGDAIFLGISRAFPDLAFDGFFALVVRGIASIDHGGHGGHLHFIRH